MNLKQKKLNWTGILVVAACFCMSFVCLGFCSSNKSLYLGAITEALGIKRSLFSINDSCRYVSTAVVNLFFGTLIVKVGVRKLVAAGFLCLITSTLIYATATNVAVFYVGGSFLGIGLSWCTTTMVSYLVGKWYPESVAPSPASPSVPTAWAVLWQPRSSPPSFTKQATPSVTVTLIISLPFCWQ